MCVCVCRCYSSQKEIVHRIKAVLFLANSIIACVYWSMKSLIYMY